ncbi:hypothetical protein AVEN_12220-1 [Araneus ventricosus]|uniref:Uncharacterized protein n=1 Tax=Araneus ventricosus TaxID=182803 RepID=A0A4Y2HXZ0_ARAVE|nr:hypothetical protein AVEN_12220-1 [Araneus ventricosus]
MVHTCERKVYPFGKRLLADWDESLALERFGNHSQDPTPVGFSANSKGLELPLGRARVQFVVSSKPPTNLHSNPLFQLEMEDKRPQSLSVPKEPPALRPLTTGDCRWRVEARSPRRAEALHWYGNAVLPGLSSALEEAPLKRGLFGRKRQELDSPNLGGHFPTTPSLL